MIGHPHTLYMSKELSIDPTCQHNRAYSVLVEKSHSSIEFAYNIQGTDPTHVCIVAV